MSPFQIGSEGRFRGVRFGVVGRLKIGWAEGSWNEWFIVSDDGRKGWLAEAQGFYSPCFETTDIDAETMTAIKKKLGDISNGALGVRVTIGKTQYKVVDVKEAECIGSEGELPFNAPQGRKTTSIDLLAGDGGFASIEVTPQGLRIYEGAYVDWAQLDCKYYRTFEGW